MEVLSSQPLLTRVREMLLNHATGNKSSLTQVCNLEPLGFQLGTRVSKKSMVQPSSCCFVEVGGKLTYSLL